MLRDGVMRRSSTEGDSDRGSHESNTLHKTHPAEPTRMKRDTKHEDVDWAGLVATKSHRRHIINHRALENGLMQTEQGIVSSNEKNDWLQKRRDKSTTPDTSHSGASNGLTDADHWKTSSQRMNDGEQTRRDQLTLDKRSNPKRNLATISQSSGPLSHRMVESGYLNCRPPADIKIGTSRCQGRNGTMLTNIGEALAADIRDSAY